MRNIARINNFYNRREAERDWRYLLEWCEAQGVGNVARELAPPEDAGHRRIDKSIGQLRAALVERGVELPKCPSSQRNRQ